MKCENCGKNEVNFVMRSNSNGRVQEVHLCSDCAEQLGYTQRLQAGSRQMERMLRLGNWFAPMPLLLAAGGEDSRAFGGMDDFFGDFFGEFFGETGGLNAPQSATQTGEKPLVSEAEQKQLSRQRACNALRQELRQAVEAEDFERAATLRDQLHAKEREQD
ncbi:MAG: UvrB/UvrC motif-containing protein [Oscillospiraceae bacterium]